MIRNFFLITFRNILRHLGYTLINVIGLGVGVAACIVIFLVVNFELSFDKFHERESSLYRITRTTSSASGIDYGSNTPYPFAAAFRSDFPDIPLNTQFHFHEEAQAAVGAEKHKVTNILFADSLFFRVFDFEVLSGSPNAELGQPGKVFLTESLAKKILTKGETHLKLANKLDLEVVGLIKDPPPNSHIKFSMIVSMPSFSKDFLGLPIEQWGMNVSGFSYAVLPEGMTPASLENRFKQFVSKYYSGEDSKKLTYELQPLRDVHFDERYGDTVGGPGYVNKSSLLILSLLGGFILIVACINFVNLSTALAVKKSREVGVRKTLGASRKQLVFQYLSEAFIVTLISTVLAIVVSQIALPAVNSFLQKSLSMDLTGGLLPVFLLVLVLFTSLLAGLYPAFVLSSFSAAAVLKNKLTGRGGSGGNARKYLVVFQFVIAQMLIIGTLVVADQMEFLHSKPLGFSREAIVNVTLPDNKREPRELFGQVVGSLPGVEKVSFGIGAPTADAQFGTDFSLTERGREEEFNVDVKPVDVNYLETYGMELVAGRWFYESEEKLADIKLPEKEQRYTFVVNEALVRKLGFTSNEEILGKNISLGLNDIIAPVVGVVKDFHIANLHETIEPVILMHFWYFYQDAGIRFNTANTNDVLKGIEKAFAKVYPDYLFTYRFLDDHLNSLYAQEKQTFTLIRIFAGLSILISCLGLLGLVSFITQQKIKEVGIRKVFGASVASIVLLFSKNFVGLIVIAFVLAAPIAWYAMKNWLETFAYRTTFDFSIFAIAIVSTLIVACAAVLYQSIKAAVANPTQSLRNE
jgi:putative ABC transport system permease protein